MGEFVDTFVLISTDAWRGAKRVAVRGTYDVIPVPSFEPVHYLESKSQTFYPPVWARHVVLVCVCVAAMGAGSVAFHLDKHQYFQETITTNETWSAIAQWFVLLVDGPAGQGCAEVAPHTS